MKFGVFIPPKRKKDEPKAPVTLEFVLAGWVPSKKNLQVPTFNKGNFMNKMSYLKATSALNLGAISKVVKDTRCYLRNAAKVEVWTEKSSKELLFQAQMWRVAFEKAGIAFPITRCSIHIRYCWADLYRRDNVNRDQSIFDILVSTGIILDDMATCLFKTSSEADTYVDEITDHVTQIFVTAYNW